MKLNFGIFGCGPSGLLAAHAVTLSGHNPIIYSVKKPSRQYGAQWLHRSIPELTSDEPEGSIKYYLRGTDYGYAEKVYGDSQHPVSFGEYAEDLETQDCWDLRGAYKKLWDLYSDIVVNKRLSYKSLERLLGSGECDYWMSTVPLPSLCFMRHVHNFDTQPVWVHPGLPAGISQDVKDDNFVVYNGERDGLWYRASKVFGHSTTEWPFSDGSEPPTKKGLWLIEKPIKTNCTCWIVRVHRLGRYGMWTKGVLTHHAFEEALEYVQSVTEGATIDS